jgi:ribonuclease P protein component
LKEFAVSKKEIISSKNEFDQVFNSGKTIYSNSRKLKAIFYINKNSGSGGLKVAFAVHKKAGSAVWRNRVRRLLRESFRLNKVILSEGLKNVLLLVVFSLNSINQRKYINIKLTDVMNDVVELMNKIKVELEYELQS